MTKIKICGLKREEDINYANNLKLDYIGFVFAEKSKRYVSLEEAKKLKNLLSNEIKSVGVFVNESIENILRYIDEDIIDIIQLHGDETEEYISKLKSKTNNKIIKAFEVKSENDLELAKNSSADYILLDSGKGTGKTFDWNKIKSFDRNFFLAGGISKENINEAIDKFNPYALDASSSLETNDVKDFEKMKEFVEIVRRKR
ncbi:phosphoribosylanthranilate isomerase [Peptoniphilus sp. MSJ-1]|uniref:N-(5'-phosphoribosyl)anthranilate isomerase n=1 Tax=Peptoniphilus ovalis TaxID=2841503 RepID=A0ABS6FHC7_9FIRM|nr:phosphoribosylanthranilate isomerase [Peptoniphilus ovalis]MBU5669371.1 phosphoribosylanthranilate isomerase [Peptoniphilus ovalis]